MENASEKKPRRCTEEANLARREEILETATGLFAEHGFSDAVTQALADRLGVGKGTIYRHFPSKRDLFLAAADRVMRKMQEQVNVNIAGIEDGFERIERAIATFLGFFADHPEFVELLIQERAYFKDRKRPTYFEHREINVQRWRQLYREMIVQGRIREMPVERITDVLSNVIYGVMVTNLFNGTTTPPDVQAKEILDIVFLGILTNQERQRHLGETPCGPTGLETETSQLKRSVNEIFGGANAHDATLVDDHDGADAAGQRGGHRVSAGPIGAGQDDPDRGL